MKFVEVSSPEVMSYYVAPKFRKLIKDKFIAESNSYIADNELYVVIDYDSDLYSAFKLYIDKTEKITLGDMYKYQYELGIPKEDSNKDDMLFKITTDGGSILNAKIKNSYMDEKDTMVIIFTLLW